MRIFRKIVFSFFSAFFAASAHGLPLKGESSVESVSDDVGFEDDAPTCINGVDTERWMLFADRAELLAAEGGFLSVLHSPEASAFERQSCLFLLSTLYTNLLNKHWDDPSNFFTQAKTLSSELVSDGSDDGYFALFQLYFIAGDQESMQSTYSIWSMSTPNSHSWRFKVASMEVMSNLAPSMLASSELFFPTVDDEDLTDEDRELLSAYISRIASSMAFDKTLRVEDLMSLRQDLVLVDSEYPSVDLKSSIGLISTLVGEPLLAQGYYQLITQEDPENARALYNFGIVSGFMLDDFGAARMAMRRMVREFSDDLSPAEMAVVYLFFGRDDFIRGDLSKAIADYGRAIVLDPSVRDAIAHSVAEMVHEKRLVRRTGSGSYVLRRLGDLYGYTAMLMWAIGDLDLFSSGAELPKRIGESLEDGLSLDETLPRLQVLKAKIAARKGEVEEARSILETAGALDPSDGLIDFEMALIEAEYGEQDECVSSLSAALSKDQRLSRRIKGEPSLKELLRDGSLKDLPGMSAAHH